MAKNFRRRGLSYTDYVPGLGAGDNPLGDLTDDETDLPTEPPERPPQPPRPPSSLPPDLPPNGGPGNSDPYQPPQEMPPADERLPPADIPDDPILGPPGDGGRPSFRPHYMYDPATGEAFFAATYEDHLRYEALGYVHTRPDTATGGDTGDSGSEGGIFGGEKGDFVLIGLASMLFFGSIILGLRRGD